MKSKKGFTLSPFSRKKGEGFTLIELLVVIAIIGILAAIVLVSLRGAPGRAKDARIKAAMNQVRAQAELIWTEPGSSSYLAVCGSASTLGAKTELQTIQTDIAEQQGTLALTCQANDDDYCVSAELTTEDSAGATQYFCVDSGGRAVTESAEPCDATNLDCLLP